MYMNLCKHIFVSLLMRIELFNALHISLQITQRYVNIKHTPSYKDTEKYIQSQPTEF